MNNTRLLANRNLLLLTQGQLVNQAGSQIALAATVFWLKQSTDSPGLIGLLSACAALPLLLLAPLGGAVADRLPRRNILIALDLLGGTIACITPFFLQSSALSLTAKILLLFGGNLMLSSAVAFTGPAITALVPDLVPPVQMPQAVAFAQVSGFIALIGGQALAGVLLTRFSPIVLFFVDGATYFFSSAAESLVRVPAQPATTVEATPRGGIIGEIGEGLEYMWRRPGMRALLFAAIPLNVFSAPIIIFLPFYTTRSLGQPLSRYGYLLAAQSAGLLAGYAWGGKFRPQGIMASHLLFACVIANALICVTLSRLHSFLVAQACLLVFGVCAGYITLTAISALISHTETDKRGRIAAVLMMVTQGVTPLAMIGTGKIGDMLHGNVGPVYAACGMALALVGCLLFTNQSLRAFLRTSEPVN